MDLYILRLSELSRETGPESGAPNRAVSCKTGALRPPLPVARQRSWLKVKQSERMYGRILGSVT
jgi:hypothetical protein